MADSSNRLVTWSEMELAGGRAEFKIQSHLCFAQLFILRLNCSVHGLCSDLEVDSKTRLQQIFHHRGE